jgi:hypothetical protein
MRISIKLMAILGGLLVMGQAGYFIMRFVGNSRSSSSSKKGDPTAFILAFGVVLFIVGYIGLFFGRLIKAAVCRQRESLADAASVQYTRNPKGLVYALKRIQSSQNGSTLSSKNSEDVNHFCFCPALSFMLSNLLATHPPIEKRIAALDPNNEYGDADFSNQPSAVAEAKISRAEAMGFNALASTTLLAAHVDEKTPADIRVQEFKQSIGNLSEAHISVAKDILASIPLSLQDAIRNPEQVELVFYAFLLPNDAAQNQVAEILAARLDKEKINQVYQLKQELQHLGRAAWLALIDIGQPAFKANTLENRRSIYNLAEKIANIEEEKLFEFTLLAIIAKSVEVTPPRKNSEKYTSFKAVNTELRQLISFVIASGNPNPEKSEILFKNIMAKSFSDFLEQRKPIPPMGPKQLRDILFKLKRLSPLCKEELINACLTCVQNDGVVKIPEAELIRAIGTVLDCPIPPLIPT